jgi:DNA-binding NtrC family response regulator
MHEPCRIVESNWKNYISRMEKTTILIIEDDDFFRPVIRTALEKDGFNVEEARNCTEAISALNRTAYPVVICDYLLGDGDGISLLQKARSLELVANSEWILVTAHADENTGMTAVQNGFFDFIAKPFHLANLAFRVKRALEKIDSSERIELLSRPRPGEFETMIGSSAAMEKVFETIRRIADKETLVLIEGETGTGKELVARAIHDRSPRKNAVFLPLNCGSLSEHLLESELFGHEKGSFTGAGTRKYGIFETAREGTVFLDEINSASVAVQSKLLRFLETGEFLRVGGTDLIHSDARIVVASNQPLSELSAARTFREDLYHRLNVVRIVLPPLRERTGDIPLLVGHFLESFNRKYGHDIGISRPALTLMCRHAWPGNVRQLKNTIQSLVLLNATGKIEPGDLPPEFHADQSVSGIRGRFKTLKEKTVEDFETRYLVSLMKETAGNITRAAEISGLNRKNLTAKLADLSIDPGRYKKPRGH